MLSGPFIGDTSFPLLFIGNELGENLFLLFYQPDPSIHIYIQIKFARSLHAIAKVRGIVTS